MSNPGVWNPEIEALYRARDAEMLANIRASGRPVSIFNTDDYPREGCTVVIKVGVEDDIRMDIYRPGVVPGTPGALPMERWAPAPANAVAVRLYDWLRGRRPRHNARGYVFE